jgi:hypothetical protein
VVAVSEGYSAMVDEVDGLNAANPDARYCLGAPASALGDYTVRDRTLAGNAYGDVVASHFSLEEAVETVERLNAEPGPKVKFEPAGIVVLGMLIGVAIAATLILLRVPSIAAQAHGWLP